MCQLSNAEDVDVFYENIPESGMSVRPVPKPKPASVKPKPPKTLNKPPGKASDGSSSRLPQENSNPTILYENLHSVTNSSA